MPETLGIAALAVALLVASRAADAAIYYWDTTTTGLWSNGANWSDNGVIAGLTGTVPLSTDSVVFNQSTVNGNEIVQLDAATGIVGMTFLNTGTTTIQSSSTTAQTLTLGSGGIFVGSGAGAVTIGNATNGATVTASTPQVWTNASANALTLVQQVNLASNSLTVNGTTTLTGGVASGGSLTVGGGTVTLNAASAFSGTTTINGGSLTIGTGGSLTGSTTLSLANGALNYNPTSGTLSFATGGTTVGSGLSSVTAAAGGTVNLGAITRSAGGVLNVGSTGSVITSSANTNGILGPWAFFGSGTNTRYAVGNGASAMTGLAVTAAAASTVTSTAGTANVNVNATGTLGASASVNTLQYSGAAGTLTTTTAFTTRGILNTGTGTLTVAGSVTAASDMLVVNAANSGVTFNNSLTTLSGTQQLVFTGASGFNIGTASLGAAFISGIAGTPVIKNGANTFTITTTGAVAAISGAVPITVNGGTLSIAGSNNLTTNRIGTGAITLNAAGAPAVTVGTTGAADTFPNALNVSGAVGTAIVQTSSGGHTWSGAIAFQSGTTGGTTLRFVNQNSSASTMTVSGAVSGVGNLEFNGTGSGSPFTLSNASINNTGTIRLSSTNAAGNLNVSGTIGSNVTGISVVSAGTATMTLSGTNTFNAPVTVTSGTLSFNTINSIGAASGSALGQPTTAASGSILLGGSGRLSYTGATASSDRPIVLTASGATIQNASATAGATLTLSGGITGTNTALILRGTQNITASGVISLGTSGISKTDVGTVTLTGANLFSGDVVIAQGPLSVNSIADSGPSALGTGTTLTLGQNTANPSGTLIVTGSAANSTSRALTLLGGSAAATQTIQNDSSGGLTLGGTFTYTASTAATTLQLQGSGTGVLNSLINSATTGTPALSLTKSGTGTWTLSQNNVYQGATAVTQGTLVVNGAPAGTTGYTVSGTAGNNATLAGSGTLAAPVTMSAGTAFTGAAVNPGTVGGAGTLTVNAALTTNAFSRLNFDFNTATTAGGGVNDLLSTTTLPVLGGLTQVNVNALSPLTTGGVYTLISGYTGTIANASNLQLGEVTGDPARSLLGVLNNDGSLQVVAGGATPTNAFWANNQGTGVWNSANLGAVTTNWNTDATSGTDTTALPGATTTVRFSTTAPAPSTTTTTLGQDFSIAGLVFEASQGSTAIGIGGANTLTVGTGGITVSGGVPTITAGLALGGAQSWTNNTANPLTVGTVTNGANTVTLLGSGNFNQTGVWGNGSGGITAGPAFTGTLTLSQANTFTGAVTVNSGTVVATGNAAALGAGSLNLAGGTLRLTNASTANLGYGRNTTVSGNVAITSDVTASGAGNTYTLGTLAIGGQTLTVGGGSNVASGTAGVTFGAVTLSGAPTFTVNNPAGGGSTLLTLGAISNGANLLTFNGTGNATVSGVLGNGAGGLTMGGTGTLTLSAANTYTGATTVNAGTLAVSGTGTLGSASALTLSGGSLNLGTTSQTVGAVSITAPAASGDTIANGTLTGTSYAASNTTGTAVISAILAGTGTFTKTGGGTATLSGVNTYNGTTTLSAGTLRATTSASALGAGALSLGGGTLELANDTGLSFSRNTTVTGNAAITADRLTSAATTTTHTLGTLSIAAQTLTINRGGNITGTATGGITFGAATLTGAATFSPQANALLTFSSTTALGANTLNKSGAGSMTLTGVVSGGPTTAGNNAVNVTAGSLTLTAAGNTFSGDIVINGSTAVVSMAGGTFTTANPLGTQASVYKSVKLSNGGTFRLSSGNYNVNVPTATNVGAGQVFSIGTGGGTFEVASGSTLTIDDGTGAAGTAWTAPQLQGSGTLTKVGGGVLTLGTNTSDFGTAFTGGIVVSAGRLVLGGTGNPLGSTTAGTTVNSGGALNVNGTTQTVAEPLTIVGAGETAAPAGALTNLSGTAATWVGPITLGGAATIGSSAGGGLTLSSTATVSTAGNVLTFMTAGSGRIFADGVISGTGSVVFNSTSTGDYVPRADHTYTGGTTLSSGLVAIDRDSTGPAGAPTAGAFGTGGLTLAGSQLRAGTGGNRTVGNPVTLSADTTFFTVATEKSLTFSGSVTLSGGNRTLTANAGTTVAGVATVFSGAIGDAGANLGLAKAGTGNLVLGGANTYTGGTTASAGTLVVTGSLANNTGLSLVPATAGGAVVSFVNNAANTPANFSSLAVGSATGTSILGLDLGTASDSIGTSVAATVTNAIAFHVNAAPGFGAGTYTLISAASGLTAGGATYGLGTAPGGYTYAFDNTDSLVRLTTTGATAGSRYWRGNLNTSWAAFSGTSTTNWATDAAGTTVSSSTPGSGDTVLFSATGATGPALATTLDNPFNINDLQFLSAPAGVSSVAINPGVNPGTLAPGTLTLAPASATTGLTLAQGAGAVTIAAPITLGAPQTWSVDSSTPGSGTASSLTVSGAISGTAANGITFTTTAGTTPIVLSSAANTYAGASTISASTIVQGGIANGFSPNTAWTVNGTLNTGAFNQTTGSLAGGAGIVQNASATNATLTIGSDNLASATFPGTIQNGSTGTLGLTKAGTGTQILSGSNTYTGTTTVTAGTLRIAAASAYPATSALVVSGTGTFDLFGNSLTAASLAGGATTGIITNSSASTGASTATAPGTPSGAGIYVDALTGTAAANLPTATVTDGPTRKTQLVINNANSGTAFAGLTAATLNTYSGGTVLAHNATTGTRLTINATPTGTPFGTGPIILGQSTTDKAGIFFSAALTFPSPIVFNTALGSDRVGVRADAAVTLSGVITANLAPATFTSNSATAGAFTLTNQVTGPSGLVLDIVSLGAVATSFNVTLNNATANANNYQGDTVINLNATTGKSATLNLGGANQIPNGPGTGTVVINTNTTGVGTLNLNGFSDTINGLSGNGTVDGTSGTPTLTLGDNNATATFSGVIRNTAGTLTLTKTGSGTQTLSGASTFGGPVNVNGGLIAFASSPATSGPLGNSTVVNLNGGGISYTASGTNALNRAIAIGAGNGTLDVVSSVGTLTVAGASVSSVGGSLVKTGPGNALITGTTTLGGGAGVVVNGGTLQAGFGTGGISSITVGGSGSLLFQNSATQALTLGSTGTVLTLSNGARLGFELNGATSDSITVPTGGGLSLAGGFTFDFINTGAGISATTYTLLTAPVGSALNTFTYTLGSAPLGYNYSFVTSDTQVLLQTAAYTPIYWRGGTDTSWATAANFASDSSGTTPAGRPPLANETVIFNATNAAGPTIATTLDGSLTVDSLQFNGLGTPATTQVTIAQGTGGTLTVAPASASGGIAILTGGGNATISAPLTLDATLSANQSWNVVDAGSVLTVTGDVAFGANVNKAGAGTVVLSGANSGSGNFSLTAGRLRLNSPAALGTGSLSIAAGTTLDNTSGSAVAMTGNGPINVNGDFTFTGSSSLGFGSGAVALSGNPTVTVAANTLTLSGAISGATSLTKAGAGALTLNGTRSFTGALSINAGALTLGGNSTANGTVTLSAGTLNLGDAGALGTGGFVIAAGTTIDNTSGGPLTNANANATTLNGGFTFTGTDNLNLGTGAISMTATPTITVAAKTLTLGGNITGGALGLTKAGTGTLSLSGSSTYGGATTVSAGTLNLTGTLGNVALGAIGVAGGGTLNVAGIGAITGNASSTVLTYGTTAGVGVVNYNSTATTTLRATVGGDAANSAGVLNLSAGTINVTPGTTTGTQAVAKALSSYGYLNVTGGTYRNTTGTSGGARFTVSNSGGTAAATAGTNAVTAVINVSGTGFIDHTNAEWWLNYGMGQITVADSGRIDHTGSNNPFAIFMDTAVIGGSYGVLNLAGSNAQVLTGAQPIRFGNSTTNGAGNTGFVNLAAGTLSTGATVTTSLPAAPSTINNAYFNYAGATIRATASANWVPASSASINMNQVNYGPITNSSRTEIMAQVGTSSDFSGGVTFDTNAFTMVLANPIQGASGVGVTQADLTVAGGSGYAGAPAVVFSTAGVVAGGSPAAGYALMSGGAVTGIVITSPGTYSPGTTPTISLIGGGATTPATATSGALTTANTSGGLNKIGAGTLTLSGANTYTGPTVITAGTLQLGAAGTSGSLSPSSAISTSGTLAFNRTDTLTQGTNFAATIGGSGGLSQVGTGTVVLNGVNTYTGPTTLTAGTLSVAAASNLGDAASNLVFDGGTLQITGTTLASLSGIGHAVSFNAGKTVGFDINNAAHTFTADQALTQGTGGLNKLGAGTLVLSQTNAFTGATSITAGTLVIAGATNVGAATVTVSSGSTLTVTTGGTLTTTGELRPGAVSNGNQFTVQSGAAVNAGSITSPWGTSYAIDGTLTTSGTWTVSTNRTTDTFNGAGTISASALTIGNASTGVNYTGTGVINITNAVTIASNSGTGNAAYTQTSGTLNAGSILLGDSTTNTTGTRTFNLNGGRVNIGSGGIATTGTTTATRVVNLGAGTLGARADWSSSLAVSLTSATPGVTIDTLDSVDGTTGRTVTLSGILSGTGSLTKASVGTLLLSAANTFTGTTTVGGGVLALNNNLAIQNSILSTSGDGTIAFGSGVTTPTLGGLSGLSGDLATEVSSGYGGVTSLTLNPGTGISVSYGGVIADGATGMSLTKAGPGTQVLAGANTYTGATTITGGILSVGADGNLGTVPGTASAASLMINGGTLSATAGFTLSSNRGIALGTTGSTGGTIDVASSQTLGYGGIIANNGGANTLTKTGAGTLALSGTNTYTGGTTINAGTLALGGSGTLGSASALTLSGGSLDLGTTSQTVGAVSITAPAAGGDTIANGSLTGTSYAASNTTGNAIISANLLGTGGFTKTGAGTATLSGISTYTGTTTINQGAVKLIGSAVLGGASGSTTDTGNIVFGQALDSGVLEFDTVANLGPADQIRFRNTGGTAGLGGELLYVGTTNQTLSKTIQCDTSIGIRIESNSVGGSLTVNGPFSQTNRALFLGGSGTGDNTLASVFSGTGGVTKRDPGRWVFSVAQTYSGSTTIDQGTLAFAADQTMTGGLVYGAANAATNTGRLDLGLASATFPSLLVRTNSATANTVAVGAGKTLTVNGTFTLGYDAAGGTGATRSNLTVSGAGGMSVTGTTITIGTNQAAVNAAYWNEATLDVTGLASFSTNVTTFNIGVGTTTQGPGTLLLSDTANIIVATTLTAGDTGPNNGRGTGRIQLGAGTNLIQVDTFNIGRGKNTGPGLVEFLSKTAGSPGTVTIVNKAGTGAANITVGDNNGTATGGGAVGTLDLRGHVATVTAGTLLAGRNNMASSTGSVTSDIYFDAGTFTVNTLTVAQKTGAGTGGVTATLNVGGGSFTVNAGGAFTLGSQATAGTASATFNLTGGTFTSNADILDGGGATTSTINLSGGTLDMAGRSIGNATNVIDVLTLASGGLRNVAQINNGSAITKTTAGTLALTGTSSYTGQTLVQAGTLSFDSIANVGGGSSALGAPANAGNGTIALGSAATGATLQYLGGTVASTDRVVSLAGTTGGATLDSSGAGAITFASNLTASGAGSKTLTLSGTNTGANTLAGIIPDNSVANPTALAKTGVGRWVVSGGNTYTGGTTVSGGTLALAGAGTLGGGAVLVAGGTLDLGGLSTSNVINFQSGGLANANLATTTNVLVGATLTTNGLTLGGSVNVTGSLEGSGTVGLISGAGVIAPGSSPGILTASQLDFSGGIGQKFEFTNANVDPTWSNALASVNDVLRLTNANPFNGTSTTSANVFDIYFDVASLSGAERFYGGVFTDSTSDPFDSLRNATYNYYVRGDGSGPVSYKGTGYYTLAQYNAANSTSLSVIVGTQQVSSATFATGEVVNGYVQVLAVPEPGVLTLLLAGAAALAGFRFSRGCRGCPASGMSDVRPDRR